MASLRRVPQSPYYIACFTLPDGRATQRSTRSTNRHEAERIAWEYADAAKQARAGRLTEHIARQVISDIYEIANRQRLPDTTIGAFFESWLKRKAVETGPKSHRRYEVVVEQFLDFMGLRRKQDLIHLTSADILAFREKLSLRVSPATVNVSLKVLKAALNQARKDGLVLKNEAENVVLLKREKFQRRPFTLDEIKKVLAVADQQWRGIILVGLYTGLRLGDAASLRWSNIDLQNNEINVLTSKTGRRQCLPIAKPLFDHLSSLVPKSNEPLFPKACQRYQSNVYGGSLSHCFYRLLAKAGLVNKRNNDSTGKGRTAKREQSELSFHCLRHTTTSLLKNAGVSDAIARDIIGHESAAVSRSYTHIDAQTKQAAVAKLPSIV